MIVFKIIKDAYVLKCIDGKSAPAQQLQIALSRSALPALTTGIPGPVGHTLSALFIGITTLGPWCTQRSASIETGIVLAEKKKKNNQKEKKYIQGPYAARGERNKSRRGENVLGFKPQREQLMFRGH